MIKLAVFVVVTTATLMAGRPAHSETAAPAVATDAPVWISSENPFCDTPWWSRAAKKPDAAADKPGKPEAAEKGGKPGKPGGKPSDGFGRPSVSKVWLMTEDVSGEARCLPRAGGRVEAFGNDLQPVEAKLASGRGCTTVTIDTGIPGRYLLFYKTDRVVRGVRHSLIAKHEKNYIRHGDHGIVPGRGEPDAVAFNLERLPLPDEPLFFRYRSGDLLPLRVTERGQPVAGAVVTLTTGAGWSKRLVSDAEGKVTFQLIRDYYPEWGDFDKNHKERFVVTAQWEGKTPGSYEGTPYSSHRKRVTYAGQFYPETAGYESYAYALIFGTAALILTWVIVYWYRRRRVRPFEEVTFDEKG
jgi:hypothetical protein